MEHRHNQFLQFIYIRSMIFHEYIRCSWQTEVDGKESIVSSRIACLMCLCSVFLQAMQKIGSTDLFPTQLFTEMPPLSFQYPAPLTLPKIWTAIPSDKRTALRFSLERGEMDVHMESKQLVESVRLFQAFRTQHQNIGTELQVYTSSVFCRRWPGNKAETSS